MKKTNLINHLITEISTRYIDSEVHDRLPSERLLAEELGASRVALRSALKFLEEDGRVYKLPGGKIRFIDRKKDDSGKGVAESKGADQQLKSIYDDSSGFSFSVAKASQTVHLTVYANDLGVTSPACVVNHWKEAVKSFQKENPTIKVDFTPWTHDLDDLSSKLESADIIQAPTMYHGFYNKIIETHNMDFFIANDYDFNHKLLFPQAWDDVTGQNKVSSIPYGIIVPTLVTLKKTSELLGLKKDGVEWDWIEFVKVCEQYRKKTGKNGLILSNLMQLLFSVGLNFLEVAKKSTDNDSKELLESILANTILCEKDDVDNALLAKNGGFAVRNMPCLTYLNSDEEGPYDIYPFPSCELGSPYRITMGLFINANSKFPIECWQFIKHMLKLSNQRRVGSIYHMIPAVKSAFSSLCKQDSVFGDIGFVEKTLENSFDLKIPYEKVHLIESNVLAPELYKLYQGLSSYKTTIMRISMLSKLILNDKNLFDIQ